MTEEGSRAYRGSLALKYKYFSRHPRLFDSDIVSKRKPSPLKLKPTASCRFHHDHPYCEGESGFPESPWVTYLVTYSLVS